MAVQLLGSLLRAESEKYQELNCISVKDPDVLFLGDYRRVFHWH